MRTDVIQIRRFRLILKGECKWDVGLKVTQHPHSHAVSEVEACPSVTQTSQVYVEQIYW